jgi:hypothetical protein
VAGVVPNEGQALPSGGMVLARGRFDDVKIDALMREHGADVEDYHGKQVLTARQQNGRPDGGLSLTFVEPGLVAVGSTSLVRNAVDLKSGGDNVTANTELMNRVRSLNGNAWAVGRFDALVVQGSWVPAGLASQIPPITWFAASSYIDSGLRGVVRADARDEEAANNLREVIRGFVALAKLQTASQPAVKSAVDSLDIQGTGTTVGLAFDVPGEAIDALGSQVRHK